MINTMRSVDPDGDDPPQGDELESTIAWVEPSGDSPSRREGGGPDRIAEF